MKRIKDVSWDYRSTNEITVAILGGTGAIGSYSKSFLLCLEWLILNQIDYLLEFCLIKFGN